MPYVLTTASTIKCAHQGTVVLVASQQLLKVDGQPVLVQGDLNGATIVGCTTPPSTSSSPCTTVTTMIVGAAVTTTVGGKPVLLDTASGMTNGIPAPATWSVQSAGQSKLSAS